MIEELGSVFDVLKEYGLTSCGEKTTFVNELKKQVENLPVRDTTLKRKLSLTTNPIIHTSAEMAQFINNHPDDYVGLVRFLRKAIENRLEEMAAPSTAVTYSEMVGPKNPNQEAESTTSKVVVETPKESTPKKPVITTEMGFPTVVRQVPEEKTTEESKPSKKQAIEIVFTITSLCKQADESIQFLSQKEKEKLIGIFKEALIHQKGLYDKKYLKTLFGKIIVEDRNERKFYQKEMEQEIVPTRYYAVKTSEKVSLKNIESYIVKDVEFKTDYNPNVKEDILDVKGKADIFNFCNYFKYLDNKINKITKFQYILPEFIDYGINKVQEDMYGMKHHVELMRTEVRMLSSFNIPRGFLFWGPPGTGKTTVAKKLCDYWTIKQVCESLASGDFKQGYQGDSEKMIRHIGERASAIPWILSAIVIDEIDALAQSREGGHGEKGDVNMISILLSMIGGMNDVPNLIFFGSTNLYQTMDEAFLRRMDGKFFIGKPSFSARKKWIKHYTKGTDPDILLDKSCYAQTVEQMQILTINFSHDAMLKLLTKMRVNYKHDFKDLKDGIAIENIVGYITHICKMNKIYFGRYILTELSSGLKKLTSSERYSSLTTFWESSAGQKEEGAAYSGKILVDLTDSSKSFGLEYGYFLKQEEMGVEEVLESILHSPQDLLTLMKLKIIKENQSNLLLYEDTKKVMTFKVDYNVIKNAQPKTLIEGCLNLSRESFKNYLLEKCKNDKKSTEESVISLRRHTEQYIREIKNQLSDKRPLKQTKANYFSLNYKNNEDRERNDLSLEEALTILLKFGVVGNFDAVYYVDANTLYANNLLSEDRIMQYIESLNSECNEYNRSMIIFDLDSIAELRRNYSGFKDQDDALEVYETENKKADESSFHSPTFNYSMMRPQVITRIIRLLSNTKYTAKGPSIWYTAISSDKYIINMVKREVKWPDDETELNKRKELEELRRTKICKHCSKEFTEEENTEESCCYHSLNKLYFEQDRRFMEEYDQKHKKEALAKISNDLERRKYLSKNRNSIFSLIDTYSKEEIEKMIEDRLTDINVNEVRWVCCGRGLKEDGENVCKHEEYELPSVKQPVNQATTSFSFNTSTTSSTVKPSLFTNTNASFLSNNISNNASNLTNTTNSLFQTKATSNSSSSIPSMFSQPLTQNTNTAPVSIGGMDNLCVTCKIGIRHRELGILLPYCSNYCASRDLCINCKLKPKYFDMSTGTLHQFCGDTCEKRYKFKA